MWLDLVAGKSHALHERVEQLCTRAIKWADLKRKPKVESFAAFSLSDVSLDVGCR